MYFASEERRSKYAANLARNNAWLGGFQRRAQRIANLRPEDHSTDNWAKTMRTSALMKKSEELESVFCSSPFDP